MITITTKADRSNIDVHRFEGPEADEYQIRLWPRQADADTATAAQACYLRLSDFLDEHEADADTVLSETAFVAHMHNDLPALRAARARFSADMKAYSPTIQELGQPPLSPPSCIELLLYVVIPRDISATKTQVQGPASGATGAAADTPHRAVLSKRGEQRHCYGGGIWGSGVDAREQAVAMFEQAQALLTSAGMSFADVVRTWIYLPDMDRDYPGLNQGRRAFFEKYAVDPIPASTGIGALLPEQTQRLGLAFHAVSLQDGAHRSVMTTPTLNEAPEYGSDFARGMRVEERNRVGLYISGTASLDESGATVHLNDIDSQVDRMLLNVKSLLAEQGASFRDIAYAITYIKHPTHSELVTRKLQEAGYSGFPHVVVQAEVCRPELLCETEAFALLKR